MDVSKLAVYLPRSLASAIPERILYHHGQVGECNDLIFGFSLVDYAMAHNLQEDEPPKIIQICIREIDQRGLEAEGIYRVRLCRLVCLERSDMANQVSGRHAVVQSVRSLFRRSEIHVDEYAGQMQHEIERDESKFEFKPKDDIYAVASLLKVGYVLIVHDCCQSLTF
jgi:hypothetical protein